jgi:cytochrome c551/c552
MRQLIRRAGTASAALLILALFLAGCKDGGSNPVAPVPSPPSQPPPTNGDISFSLRVLPMFQRYGCTGCHGGTNGLTVGTVGQLLAGGARGPAIVAGNSASSLLILKLSPTPPAGDRMPQGGPYLSTDSIKVIRDWIDQGAKNN